MAFETEVYHSLRSCGTRIKPLSFCTKKKKNSHVPGKPVVPGKPGGLVNPASQEWVMTWEPFRIPPLLPVTSSQSQSQVNLLLTLKSTQLVFITTITVLIHYQLYLNVLQTPLNNCPPLENILYSTTKLIFLKCQSYHVLPRLIPSISLHCPLNQAQQFSLT